jgi:hypothetical protein
VALVDTPGFDDSREEVTDADILRRIAEFLKREYVPHYTMNLYLVFDIER